MSDSESNANRLPKRRQRKISSLTQQQRLHKRDLDRKAQRALRQRTKSRIQDLEADLVQLKASSSEQDCKAQEEIRLLREENLCLKSRLQDIRSFVCGEGLLISHQGSRLPSEPNQAYLGEVDCITVESPPTNEWESIESLSESPTSHETADQLQVPAPLSIVPNYPEVYSEDLAPQGSGNHGGAHITRPADAIALTAFACDNEGDGSLKPSTNSFTTSHGHRNIQSAERDEYLDGIAPFTGSESMNTSLTPPGSSAPTDISFYSDHNNLSGGIASLLPRHSPVTCPLDQILLDFLSSRRAMASSGVPIDLILGPKDPSVAAVLNPDLAPTAHPVSRVMAEVVRTFPGVAVAEVISFMYLMHRTMRWQISRTNENYRQLPQWLTPTAVQITVPHAAWIDNIPWPGVRDILIENTELYPFEMFSEIYSQNVSVSWPYDAVDAVTSPPSWSSADVALNPIFEKHILKLSNWTVSQEFLVLLPQMTAAICSRD